MPMTKINEVASIENCLNTNSEKEYHLTSNLVEAISQVLKERANTEYENSSLKIKLMGFDQRRNTLEENARVAITKQNCDAAHQKYLKEINNIKTTACRQQELSLKLEKELINYKTFLKDKILKTTKDYNIVKQEVDILQFTYFERRQKLKESVETIKILLATARKKRNKSNLITNGSKTTNKF